MVAHAGLKTKRFARVCTIQQFGTGGRHQVFDARLEPLQHAEQREATLICRNMRMVRPGLRQMPDQMTAKIYAAVRAGAPLSPTVP